MQACGSSSKENVSFFSLSTRYDSENISLGLFDRLVPIAVAALCYPSFIMRNPRHLRKEIVLPTTTFTDRLALFVYVQHHS